MIIQPKVKGFICTTAHPKGCRENVKRQITYVKKQPAIKGAKNVLVIGCSTGYGLASRISLAFAAKAKTLGIMFEKAPTERRCATAGYYNTLAFEEMAKEDGLYAKTINGDAFSDEIKAQTIDIIKKDLGTVDMIVYSIAAPRRTKDGVTYSSCIKAIGDEFKNKNLDLVHNTITDASIPYANEEEVANTIKVMGGEDWKEWIEALDKAGVLAPDTTTVAYSYIGPEVTHAIYKNGTIGMAKNHLVATSKEITSDFQNVNAFVSVNKALVTQASSAIPVVPLYISLLYKVMKDKGIHEGCIEQMYRLFHDKMFGTAGAVTDDSGLIRVDDWELREDVQTAVMENWDKVTTKNLKDVADIDGYWDDFYKMFGFHFDNVNYDEDIPLV
ncbi:enoyl-ACP reductase FabV [[Clostridium] polysaccharolyticum]|jgi:enoyl-[acyl-carrier protein] reductase/trans-2-enoyl-CoA reductase (NAD+)|uniref:Trans-2-enoyl-CoA reductase [NADH] n=1 Tax=[Clostridium] polysaccharolyticum TaxID=29364 RepID=A0A1I0C6L2_9FIRM|nr:enoyl-ACP reductase FabV [[Clostridium] polysaccharolyticum]SET15183.1 enoyl-[acyl-carrier protein] reductase / trans-2-enoyl-CoA reductase (NAD+) [[Clostridium] polysaccharolyticum]